MLLDLFLYNVIVIAMCTYVQLKLKMAVLLPVHAIYIVIVNY